MTNNKSITTRTSVNNIISAIVDEPFYFHDEIKDQARFLTDMIKASNASNASNAVKKPKYTFILRVLREAHRANPGMGLTVYKRFLEDHGLKEITPTLGFLLNCEFTYALTTNHDDQRRVYAVTLNNINEAYKYHFDEIEFSIKPIDFTKLTRPEPTCFNGVGISDYDCVTLGFLCAGDHESCESQLFKIIANSEILKLLDHLSVITTQNILTRWDGLVHRDFLEATFLDYETNFPTQYFHLMPDLEVADLFEFDSQTNIVAVPNYISVLNTLISSGIYFFEPGNLLSYFLEEVDIDRHQGYHNLTLQKAR